MPLTRIFLEGGDHIDVEDTMTNVWALLQTCHASGEAAQFPLARNGSAEGEAWIKPFSTVGIMAVTQHAPPAVPPVRPGF